MTNTEPVRLLQHRFAERDIGVLCSFGAGYSVGSVVLRKLA